MAIDKARVLAAAQKQLARNNIDKALKELSRIVREDPKDLRVRQKVAELLARQGKIGEAMREFAVVAEAYERGGFYPKAAAIYKQMLRFEPDQMRWHLALGEIYQQLALLSDAMDHFNIVARHFEEHGNSREKLDIYEKLLKLNPDSLEYGEKLAELHTREADTLAAFDVWRNLAETLEQRNDAEALVRVYEKMSKLKPDELSLVRALADLYLDRGDPRRALAKLQICFKADPQDTETLNLLADAFVDLGEADKAVAVLKELAQIYESLGYEDYRNQVYDRIAEIDPAQGASFEGDSSLELPGGEEAVAGLELSDAQQLSEDTERAVAEAEVYLQYGLADKAQGLLEKATAQEPAAFDAHRMLVRIHIAGGEMGQALDRLTLMYELAMDLGDYAAARACLARASEMAPEDEAAKARLQAFVEAMGEYTSPEPAVQDDVAAMASAIELGQSIAGSVSDQAAPSNDFDGTADEFDFDDAEMQKLAAELSREIDDGEPSARFDDPFAEPPTSPAYSEPVVDDGEDDPLGSLLSDLDLGLDLDDDMFSGASSRSSFEIGRSYYDSGMYEDAALEFQRAIEAGEDLAGSMEYLGHTLRRMRDFRGAVDAYKQLLAGTVTERDEVLRIMFELGVTYEAAGNRRGAYKIFKKITDREPDFRDGEVCERVTSLALKLGIQ